MADETLQVLILPSRSLVAGLPPSLRCAHRAASELPGARILLMEDTSAARRFRRQLELLASVETGGAAGPCAKAPLLAVSGDGFPQPGALQAFLSRARGAGSQAVWTCGGQVVAAYRSDPAGRDLQEAARLALQARDACASLELPGWLAAGERAQAAKAERALFASLPKDTDGYLARLDRRLSLALSAFLLRFPVTPNDITTAGLALSLLGAWLLASGRYRWTLAGSLLLWFCCLLDGCDGEVARLKLLCSPDGAAYDLASDHLSHLATFIAIPVGARRAFPGLSFFWPGTLLLSGFLASAYSVWHLVLRRPEAERGAGALFIERVASRDYVYLIVLAAAAGRLDWFLDAAAVGSHLFWLALWLLAWPRRRVSAVPKPST
ncbi:MAG: CDP-alcohol phosphatidyltransferase family protein [Elusimicrobia bacterium]|nr:CDP-alcohol phosphatidyltransferase family protein [Elusimicrobiota bacterium]MDE2426018.1 CDP-alcohol phosphatidyltransferase family protein [Elusimicrobiota bacterium]